MFSSLYVHQIKIFKEISRSYKISLKTIVYDSSHENHRKFPGILWGPSFGFPYWTANSILEKSKNYVDIYLFLTQTLPLFTYAIVEFKVRLKFKSSDFQFLVVFLVFKTVPFYI